MEKDVSDRPMLFLKPLNTLSAHGNTVTLPAEKEQVDWEADLGVVINEQYRNVNEDEVMDVVRGFTC